MNLLAKLVASIIICQTAGLLGSFFTMPAIDGWYAGLHKAGFNPPNWIFAPVWTTLFLFMGVSLFLIWHKSGNGDRTTALAMFLIQLALNVVWTVIFFGLKSPDVAFCEIIVLWFAILGTIVSSYKVSKTAAILLLPYILWVSFAAVLNYSILALN